jgi:DNA-binding protein H-NS
MTARAIRPGAAGTDAHAEPVDLDDYTYGELKGLLFEVGNAIRERERADLAHARARIDAIASGAGIPLDTLLADLPTPPRYRNPSDTSQTWSGRGRQPRWLQQELAGGKSLDDFANEDVN